MKELPLPDSREMKAEEIAKQFGWVRRVNETQYKVHSQRLDSEYDVLSTETGWYCSCADHIHRQVKCKHIRAVELSFILRTVIAREPIVIKPVIVSSCPRCGSEKVVKKAVRHNKSGDIQRYLCNDCRYRFSLNLGFEKMKSSPQTVTLAMQVYFSGLSFAGTAKALRLKGVKVSHVSVYKWVRKYVGLMERYLDKITPQVGDTWRTDEMFIKIKGNMKYLFAMMDDDTRFRIAQMVSSHKGTSDVRPMFREAQEQADKKPKVLISDGAPNFAEASVKEWWTQKREGRVVHIADIRLGGKVHNNKMERQNGEWRDREKVMRSLKHEDSSVLSGMQIYHNYFRPHMGLNGRTPAEAAGIKIEGEDPWLTVIQNASHDPKANERKNDPTS